MNIQKFFPLLGLYLFFVILSCGGDGENGDIAAIPEAPSVLLSIEATHSQITISWTDNSDDEEGFVIQRRSSDEENYVQVDIVGPDETSFQDVGLDCETTYFYRVYAFNDVGNSEPVEVSITTDTCPLNPPVAPYALDATSISASQIDITWADNSDNESGFAIERKEAGDIYYEIATVVENTTIYQDIDLECETTYYYRIYSFNDDGDSNYSNEISSTTGECPLTIPMTPSNLQASPVSASQINLSWSDNSDNEDGFKIERKKAGESYSQIGIAIPDQINFSDTDLSCRTEYFYRIRAYNAAGDSDYSSEAIASTSACSANIEVFGNVETREDVFTGELILLGEVKNTGDLSACWIKITFVLRDENSVILGSPFSYINGNTLVQGDFFLDDCLRPGENGSFKIYSDVPASEVSSYTHSIDWDSENIEEPNLNLDIKGTINIEEDYFGSAIFLGEIENTGSIPACFVKIIFTMKGSWGDVLEIDSSYLNGSTLVSEPVHTDTCIRPGEVRSFEIMTDEFEVFIDSYYYHINWDENDISEPDISLSLESINLASVDSKAVFSGSVKNIGSVTASFVKVNVTMLDVAGKVIGTDFGYISGSVFDSTNTCLAPGETGTFSISTSIFLS